MPKIVDHDAYRLELASKALEIFTQHGVNGLGMRGIADAMGISKSALYHYFPSKEELFKASTEVFLTPSSLYGLAEGEDKPNNKEQALFRFISAADQRFKGEITLLLDYIKDKCDQQVREDSLLAMASQQFLKELGQLVGSDHAPQAYGLMIGGLTMRLLDGKQTSIEQIVQWILYLPNNNN